MAILVVEDNPINLKLLVLLLQAQGYQTMIARNGKEGLAMLANSQDIQLIITDYMMPEMDGLEFIAKARALPAFNHIPIIVVSGHGDLETVKQVRSVHCYDFLVKPIDKQQLIKRVERLLRSEPCALLNSRRTMDRLSIGLAEYNELVQAFAAQLGAIMPTVVLEQGDTDEPISQNLALALKDLAESASMLGAEKFILLHAKFMGRGLPARSQCAALLKSLQELETALLTYLQSQSHAARGTDAA
jgi:CheY-like chemotaxis protein